MLRQLAATVPGLTATTQPGAWRRGGAQLLLAARSQYHQGTSHTWPVQRGCGCMIWATLPWYPTVFRRDSHSQYRASIPASAHS
jgi:hypothetical protein